MIAEPAPRLTLPEDGKGQQRLTISMVKDWLNCPACFEAKYIEKRPLMRPIHYAIGSAVHGALDCARTDIALGLTGASSYLDIAEQAFEDSCEGKRFEDSEPTPDLQDYGDFGNRGKAKDFALRLARIATPRIVKEELEVGIAAVEQDLDFEGVFPFHFKGRLDVVLKDGRTRDVKTAGRNELPDDHTALQLATYVMPRWAYGEPYNPAVDTVCIIKKDDRVEAAAFPVVTHPLVLTDEQIDGAYQQIMTVARAISSGIFPVGQGFFGRHEVDHRTPSYRRLSAS